MIFFYTKYCLGRRYHRAFLLSSAPESRAQVAVLAQAFGYASSAEPSVRDSAPQKLFLGPTERFLHEFAI
jgi:hypothetical protein